MWRSAASMGRLPHIPSLVRTAAWDERCRGVEDICALSLPGSAEEGHVRLSFSVAKARSAKKKAKRSAASGIAALPPKRQCQAEFQATMLERICCQAGRPRRQWSCAHSKPCDVGNPSASRKSSIPALQEARTLLGAGHPSPCQANSRGPIKKRSASSSTSRPCQSACKPRSSSGQSQKLTLSRGRIQSGSGRGNNGDEMHRCSQRRRIRRERSPATERPCPSRMPWSDHCGARDECAERSDDSSQVNIGPDNVAQRSTSSIIVVVSELCEESS